MKTRLTDPDFDVDIFGDDRRVTPTIRIPFNFLEMQLAWRHGAGPDDRNCNVVRGEKVHVCDVHAVFIDWEPDGGYD